MLARAVTCLLVCSMLAVTVAPPAGATTGQQPNPSLSAFGCHRAPNPLNRMISVTANLAPLPGSTQMELRFVLLERLPGHRFHTVHGGDLGQWRQLSLESWAVKKPVVNLPAPATYRFKVSFRWVGSAGSVISQRTLVSGRCWQPG